MLTMRVDADVLAALKRSGPGWQTRVNSLLRDALALRGGSLDTAPEKLRIPVSTGPAACMQYECAEYGLEA